MFLVAASISSGRRLVSAVFRGLQGIAFVVGGALLLPVVAVAGGSDGYLLSIGDELYFDILDDQEPGAQYAVGDDGTVRLPFIGGVPVADLPLGVVREKIRRLYVENEIFRDPAIELSVASYRPIFVYGDVKTPGFYDFQPYLTAEQAVGLAGGPILSSSNAEDRMLQRRALEADLEAIDIDLARTSAVLARLTAMIGDRETVQWSDVPQSVRAVLARELFEGFAATEAEILDVETSNYRRQRALLQRTIAQAEKEIALLDQQLAGREKIVAQAREELARARTLVARGIQPRSAEVEATRNLTESEARYFEVKERQSGVRRQLDGLNRELVALDSQRQEDLRGELQARLAELQKLMSRRESVADRLELIRAWSRAAPAASSLARVSYSARRRMKGGGSRLVALSASDELLPGDVLMVSILPPADTRPSQ